MLHYHTMAPAQENAPGKSKAKSQTKDYVITVGQHLRVWINLTRKTSILLARQKKKIRLLTAECIISTKISNILHQRLCLYDLFGST